MEKSERNINIDIIKCFAVFFVICIHFYLYNNFYKIPVYGIRMYILIMLRTLFMTCVPLFLIISGYLLFKKGLPPPHTEEKGLLEYYKKITRIIYPYLIISVITGIVIVISSKFGIIIDKVKFPRFINGLIDFNLIGYGWYVEMYIGLFLLIPFINRMLTVKKNDTVLIISFIILTVLSTLSHTPSIFPDYWQVLWPFTYYFSGAYIAKYGIKISTKLNAFLVISAFILFGISNIIFTYGKLFNLHRFDSWSGPANFIMSILIFILLINIKIDIKNNLIKNIISNIAKLSLGIYLSSYMFDNIIYHYFNILVSNTQIRIEYFIIVVPLIFICSIGMAKFANLTENIISRAISKIKFRKPKA